MSNLTSYTGTVRFRDMGAGEFFLETPDQKYRLAFDFGAGDLFPTILASKDQTLTVLADTAPEDVVVTGGSGCPILLVKALQP